MLTDKEAAEIERQRRQGIGGPILLTWIDRLLADRRERVRQWRYLRQRLRQAFRYLDGLLGETAEGSGERPAASARKTSGGARPLCPACGKPYVRAYGVSPAGIAYTHDDARECRTRPR